MKSQRLVSRSHLYRIVFQEWFITTPLNKRLCDAYLRRYTTFELGSIMVCSRRTICGLWIIPVKENIQY